MADLGDAMDELQAWPGVCLVVTGAGASFCSGADLGLAQAMASDGEGDGAELMSLYMQHELARLGRLPCVSVAALNGPAVGGGSELSTVKPWPVVA